MTSGTGMKQDLQSICTRRIHMQEHDTQLVHTPDPPLCTHPHPLSYPTAYYNTVAMDAVDVSLCHPTDDRVSG